MHCGNSELLEFIWLLRPNNLIPMEHSARGGRWVAVGAVRGHMGSLGTLAGDECRAQWFFKNEHSIHVPITLPLKVGISSLRFAGPV